MDLLKISSYKNGRVGWILYGKAVGSVKMHADNADQTTALWVM